MNHYAAMNDYAAKLGRDLMLVQGAGGNISWKENDTLWIKASGTWLAEANQRDIFVPLSLDITRGLLNGGLSDLSPALLSNSSLRPSIETSLHLLLPHAIVTHIHAIEVLAFAVLNDGRARLSTLLAGLNWLWVDYVKPGAPLADAIADAMEGSPAPDIIVLGNHGLIVAGADIAQVDARLRDVLARCHQTPRPIPPLTEDATQMLAERWRDTGYQLPTDPELHAIARDPANCRLARDHWVMYPDHAVFLGGHAVFADPLQLPADFLAALDPQPACILMEGAGILVRDDLNAGQEMMLHCYLHVALRIYNIADVHSLNISQIAELLNWDAEKYRQSLNAAR